MQVGAYSDRVKADEMLQLLTDNGFKAKVEKIN
jgi:cell division protein FtsN